MHYWSYLCNCLLVLSVSFIRCESVFEWNCSEPVNDAATVYVPDVNIEQRDLGTAINISPGVLLIYPVTTLTCSGTVTGVEFCYRNSDNSDGFTLYTMMSKSSANEFLITGVINIPFNTSCTQTQGNNCCNMYKFESNERFELLSNDFAFGVVGVPLLGYSRFHASQYEVNSQNFDLSVNATNTAIINITNGPLRIMRFIVETPTTFSPTTTIVPPVSTDGFATTKIVTDNVETTTTRILSTQTIPTSTEDSQPLTDSTAATSAQRSSDESSSTPAIAGALVGVLVTVVLLMLTVFFVVLCVCHKRRSAHTKWKPEPNTEVEMVEGARIREGITNVTYDSGPGAEQVVKPAAHEPLAISNSMYDYARVESPPLEESKSHEYATADEISNIHKEEEVGEYTYASNVSTSPATRELPKIPSRNSHRRVASHCISDAIYMVPACDENSLYAQFTEIKIKELSHSAIILKEKLGAGQFGTVHKAEMVTGDKRSPQLVAVKTLNKGADAQDKVKFLQEAAIMGQFRHPNVVKLHGVVTEQEPQMIVLELLMTGDLKNVLIKSREGKNCSLDAHTLLSYCRQIASGMTYLSNKAFIHRDLAARNILVSEEGMCKIADFGMSRDLMDETYYISHGGKIPVRWTAPEALHYKKYSTASDVWSFGCVMYEIWSLGHKPFEAFSNTQTITEMDEGYRMAPAPGTPRAIYKLMIECWHPVKGERPTFTELMQAFSLPDSKLLRWSEEDRSVHPEATTLGAPLNYTQQLYTDLQENYVVAKVSVGSYETPIQILK